MSAVNIIRVPDAVHIFTDGASYHADGRLGAVGQKVWPLAHLNAALICRGPHLLMPSLIGRISTVFASFDELVAGIVQLAMIAFAEHKATLDCCELGPDFDLFIAGWSEARGRGESYVVCSHSTHVEAWSLAPLDDVALSPFNDEFGLWMTANAERLAATDSMSEMGAEMMEAQRGIKGDHAGKGAPIHGVGGFCQWTMITPCTITTGIVRRWPDAIGEPLGIEVMGLAARSSNQRPSA